MDVPTVKAKIKTGDFICIQNEGGKSELWLKLKLIADKESGELKGFAICNGCKQVLHIEVHVFIFSNFGLGPGRA